MYVYTYASWTPKLWSCPEIEGGKSIQVTVQAYRFFRARRPQYIPFGVWGLLIPCEQFNIVIQSITPNTFTPQLRDRTKEELSLRWLVPRSVRLVLRKITTKSPWMTGTYSVCPIPHDTAL
jgi:hypothetical protein